MEFISAINLVYVILLTIIYRVFVKLKNFVRTAVKMGHLPGLKCFPVVGHLPILNAEIKTGFPQNVVLQQIIFGTMKLFPKEAFAKYWLAVIPYIFIYRADAAETILSSTKEITKSREYSYFHSWLGLGLLTSNGFKWKKRRKMLTPAFHFRVLKDFQTVISEQSLLFVDHLTKQLENDSIDILHFITMCTLDIICETAMGVSINAQTNSNSPYIRALHIMSDIGTKRVTKPHMWKETTFGLTSDGRKYNDALKIVHGFTQNVIKTKMTERVDDAASSRPEEDESEVTSKKRLAFLDLLMEEHRRNTTFSESDIQEEVDTFMFEGHDTTAVGLSWCVYLLGHYTHIQEKVFEEVQSVLGNTKVSAITDEELKEMKYLECVIKESQRLFPSVPFIGRELEDDLLMDNKVVPKGTTCFVFISAIHRNPEHYPNPEVFDPTRFTVENSSGRHPYAYIPFSAGPRNCIGQKFALNEEKTLLANLIRNFSWKSLDSLDKVTFAPHMVSRPVPGHRIKLFKRP